MSRKKQPVAPNSHIADLLSAQMTVEWYEEMLTAQKERQTESSQTLEQWQIVLDEARARVKFLTRTMWTTEDAPSS